MHRRQPTCRSSRLLKFSLNRPRCYAKVRKNLKSKVKPDYLGVIIKGTRETKKEEVLIEVEAETEE